MDRFFYNKYSKYVKQNDNRKAGINLFLVLKKCRKSCMVHINIRYQKSFEKILDYYNVHYLSHKDIETPKILQYIISKNKISPVVYRSFIKDSSFMTDNDHKIMGQFLDYPTIINVLKIPSGVGAIQFVFEHNKKKELIFGFRIPNNLLNSQIINKMNSNLKKYKKCLNSLFDDFVVELVIRMK